VPFEAAANTEHQGSNSHLCGPSLTADTDDTDTADDWVTVTDEGSVHSDPRSSSPWATVLDTDPVTGANSDRAEQTNTPVEGVEVTNVVDEYLFDLDMLAPPVLAMLPQDGDLWDALGPDEAWLEEKVIRAVIRLDVDTIERTRTTKEIMTVGPAYAQNF
jgi:hypothetical protein